MSVTGTEIEEELSSASSTAEVDKIVLRHMNDDHVPDYIADDYWRLVTIKSPDHELELLVAPDYFALGTDEDPFRVGRESPYCAQAIADYYDSILPSTKILRAIQSQADPKFAYTDVKVAPYNIPLAKIETHNALVAANNLANKLFEKAGITPGDTDSTAIGYRKSIVVGPNLDGSKVAIYGGRWNSGGSIVQPYSTIHGSDYSDYSHGITLISRKAKLDGEKVDLRDDVFGSKDRSVYGLVIDLEKAEGVGSAQVRFDPVFPNAGKNTLARFDVSSSVAPETSTGPKSPNLSKVSEAPMFTKESALAFYNKNKKPIMIGGIVLIGGALAWAVS